MDQETLVDGIPQGTFDPLAHSLWTRFVDNGRIEHGAWLRACAEGGFVGTCRLCGSYLRPRHPEQHGTRTDYEAVCVSASCEHIVLCVGGRTLARSSQRSERPGAKAAF
jgi:hypothetical protein